MALGEQEPAQLGLRPRCRVFVDDIEANLPSAKALGMATAHHIESMTTIPELERLLGTSRQ